MTFADVHPSIHGRPSSFMQKSIRISVDVHRFYMEEIIFFYGSSSAFIWTHTRTLIRMYIRIYTATHHYICRRPSEFILDVNQNHCWSTSEHLWMSMRTFMDIRHFVYRRPSDHSWTFVSFYADVHKKIHSHPSAFIWTSIRTFIDVRQLSCWHPSWPLHASIWTFMDVCQLG